MKAERGIYRFMFFFFFFFFQKKKIGVLFHSSGMNERRVAETQSFVFFFFFFFPKKICCSCLWVIRVYVKIGRHGTFMYFTVLAVYTSRNQRNRELDERMYVGVMMKEGNQRKLIEFFTTGSWDCSPRVAMRMSHTIRRQPVGPLCRNIHSLSSPPL